MSEAAFTVRLAVAVLLAVLASVVDVVVVAVTVLVPAAAGVPEIGQMILPPPLREPTGVDGEQAPTERPDGRPETAQVTFLAVTLEIFSQVTEPE